MLFYSVTTVTGSGDCSAVEDLCVCVYVRTLLSRLCHSAARCVYPAVMNIVWLRMDHEYETSDRKSCPCVCMSKYSTT